MLAAHLLSTRKGLFPLPDCSSDMRPAALSTIIVVILVLGTVQLGVMAAPNPADRSLAELNEPSLVYEISVDEHGNAVWNISAKFPITDDNEAEVFADIAQSFEDAGNDDILSIDAYEAAVRDLRDTLDRDMSIENVDRSVNESDDRGELRLTFEWRAFAEVVDDRIIVGDVFTSGERDWFSFLRANEYLRIHAPPNHAIETSGMPVSDRTAWMDGPQELTGDNLRIVFVPESQLPTNGGGTGGDVELSAIILPALAGAGILLLLAVTILGVAYLRRYQPVVSAVEGLTGTEALTGADTQDSDDDESDASSATPDIELLSDEERVLRLIEENGGRMKQAAIVTETDWSNAKVSQLLSEMADNGEIEKLRIGRENLISLPAEDDNR